jgi:SET domain-containing protein
MSFEVRPSPIHGHGVFATRSFRPGERIGWYLARRTERDGTYVLWVRNGHGWRGYNGYGRLRFVNHTREPNAEFAGLDLHAVRAIRPGEEITVHYGDEWTHVG